MAPPRETPAWLRGAPVETLADPFEPLVSLLRTGYGLASTLAGVLLVANEL